MLVALPERDRDRDLVLVADVTLETMPEMTRPVERQDQAPEVADFVLPDIAAPMVETDPGDPPDQDAAPVATVQDFVQDPSQQDEAADMSAVRSRVAEPEVQTETDAPEESAPEPPMPTLALPGAGIDDRTESPKGPQLSAPSSPRDAPAAFKPPAPPSRATPAPEETPPTEQAPDATEIAEQQEQSAPEQAAQVPAAEADSGAEDGTALRQARPPRPRPQDFQQRLAEAAQERRAREQAEARAIAEAEEEQRAREEAEARAIAEALAEVEAEAEAAQQTTEQPAEAPADTGVEQATDLPQGPPMTQAEVEGLKLQVAQCWRLPEGVAGAEDLRVVLSVELDPTGSIVGEPRLIEPASAQSRAVLSAFEAARRAILRCQGAGFELPRDKYAQWRSLELVFDPQGVLARW